ncbi:MAG: hypothetical protein JNL50_03430 [Phycisphaerae bacterium]|nr:hypothetical protein [Phycisphaerae bacterium]
MQSVTRPRLLRAGLVGLSVVVVAGSVWARPEGEPPKVQTLFVMKHAALDRVLVDAKDQRIAAALSMLPSRINELPREAVGGFNEQAAGMVNTIISTLARPGHMAITLNAGNVADGLYNYGVVFSADFEDQKSAEAAHTQIRAMLAGANLPPAPVGNKRIATMEDTQIPNFARVSYGPRQGAGGWKYEIIVGTLDNPDSAFANVPKATIPEAYLSGEIDFSALTPLASFAQMAAGPQNPQLNQVMGELSASGLIGQNAIKVRYEAGYTKEDSLTRLSVVDAAPYADRLGFGKEALSDAELKVIPADATIASLGRGGLSTLRRALDQMMAQAPEAAQGLEQFKQMTGVDLKVDVLDALGDTFGYYASDSTGGGSIGSLVAMLNFKDRAKFVAAHAKLVEFANAALAQNHEIGKYMRVRSWKEQGVELMSLRVNGLPIPLELTYAATENWFIAGVTPQATLAAALQAAGRGDAGLAASPGVAALRKRHNGVTAITFIDSPRMLRTGYPLVSMLGSAVSNAMSTPPVHGEGRSVGMLVPTYRELSAGALPSIQVGYWDGQNYVVDTHADRSMLVNAGGALGAIMQLSPIIAAGALGAAGQTRQGGMNPEPFSMIEMVPALAQGWQGNRGEMVTPAWQIATTLDRSRYFLTSPILAGALLAEPAMK